MQTEIIHFELSQTICFYCFTSVISVRSIAHIQSYRLNNLSGCDLTFFFLCLFPLAGTLNMTPMSKTNQQPSAHLPQGDIVMVCWCDPLFMPTFGCLPDVWVESWLSQIHKFGLLWKCTLALISQGFPLRLSQQVEIHFTAQEFTGHGEVMASFRQLWWANSPAKDIGKELIPLTVSNNVCIMHKQG